MPIFDTILGKIGLARKAHIENLPLSHGLGSSDAFFVWQSQKKLAAEKAMGLNTSWVYTCIRAIAEEIANIELRLFQINKEGEQEEIFEHELLDLLGGVNSFQTGFELKYLTAAHLEFAGNAYWVLDGVENESGKPSAIYILNPRYVKVIRAPAPNFIEGYEYRIGSEYRKFEPYQIIHLKYPDPNDPYEGIGTVQAIERWINADNFASEINLQYFKNGARLSGVLESENAITREQLEFLKKSFEAVYQGVENAYQVAALPKGTKYNSLSDTPKDMDFSNLQQVMRDKILAGFRVPKTILGAAESETNRATAETANYVFAARTIKPKIQMIVSYLNEFLVPRYGDNLFLDFVDPVPENRELIMREHQAALGSLPYKSVNEVREEEGLPPVSNGDAVATNFSSIPLGKPEGKAGKPGKPRAKVSGEAKPTRRRTQHARSAEKRKEIASTIAEKIGKELKAASEKIKEIKEQKTKNITSLSDNEYEVLWKSFVARVTPYEQAQAEAIRKFNADQKKEVLTNLENATKSKAINENDIFKADEWVGALVDLSTPIMADLFEKEAKEAAALLGTELTDPLTPEVREAIKRALELMSQKYNETTLALLKEKLEQGLDEGAGLNELKDLVSQVYEFSDEHRAEQVARTEAFRVANGATQEAWKQTGVVKSIKWYTAADERVCEFCAPLHGREIGIEEGFFEKGETITGREGGKLDLDYSDVDYPPLHVSCRCYIRPENISIE